MIEVTSEVTIDRPADEVFAFLADAENNPKWQQGMERCQWTSTPPIREGSIYEQEARMLGKAITSRSRLLTSSRTVASRSAPSNRPSRSR